MFANLFAPSSSAPAEVLDSAFRAYIEDTMERVRSRIPKEIAHLLQSGCELRFANADPARAWCPEIGHLRALLQIEGETTNAAAQYVLCAVCSGSPCDVTLTTRNGDVLYFGGRRLRTSVQTRVKFDHDGLVIQTAADSVYRFSCCEGVWHPNHDHDGMHRISQNVVLLGSGCIDPTLEIPADVDLSHEAFAEAAAVTMQAIGTIATVSTDYLRWCNRVLREVQLVGCKYPDISTSRSASSHPGTVVMSYPAHLVQFIESLVHECTHQYFYLLEAVAPICRDPDESGLFFSSIVGRQRPIGRILFAYHATANILFCLTLLRERCPQLAPMVAVRMKEHTPICEQLLGVLSDNAALLSDQASAFWQPSKDAVLRILHTQSIVPCLSDLDSAYGQPQ